MKRIVLVALILLVVLGLPMFGQAKIAPKDQLYIEVSALGNLDYFYDHKMGMQMVGKELGVRTEYVGPAEYDMNAMVAAFEQAKRASSAGEIVKQFCKKNSDVPSATRASTSSTPSSAPATSTRASSAAQSSPPSSAARARSPS